MKKISVLIYVSCISLVMFSCASGPVVVDRELNADFDLNAYETYGFYQIDAEDTGRPEFKQNIEYLQKTIAEKLNERGLTQSTNPDIRINLGITVEDKIQTRETNLATDPFMYIGQRNYTWKVQEIPVGSYKEGSLTMHLIDSQENEPVWVGTIARALPKKGKNTPKTIDNAVDLLFNKMDQ